MMERGTIQWTCHFCNRMRDDADISVMSKKRLFGLMPVPIQENRRYCNDSDECQRRAVAWKALDSEVV